MELASFFLSANYCNSREDFPEMREKGVGCLISFLLSPVLDTGSSCLGTISEPRSWVSCALLGLAGGSSSVSATPLFVGPEGIGIARKFFQSIPGVGPVKFVAF